MQLELNVIMASGITSEKDARVSRSEDYDMEGSASEVSVHTASSEESDVDLRVLHAIRRIIRAVDLYSKRLALEFGITTPQLLCLEEIIAKGAMMIRSVAEEVHLSSSTIVGIIDRLEAKGLAKRERTSHDRRKVMVVPTEAGRSLVARVPPALQNTLADALKRLPSSERASIATALDKVVGLMEAGHWGAPAAEIGIGGEALVAASGEPAPAVADDLPGEPAPAIAGDASVVSAEHDGTETPGSEPS
jgi:DNA-binding MarR family transcriptional regulator